MTPLSPHLSAFFQDYLPRQREVSPHTCSSYAYTFQLLLQFASDRLHQLPSTLVLEQLDAPLILAFLDHLETARGNHASSRNTRLVAIKSFMHFIEYRVPALLEHVGQIRAIPAKRVDTPLVNYLTLDEIQAVLNAPDLSQRWGLRNRAMLHLCFAAGLRVSELIGLPVTAVEFQPTPQVRVRGKGRKARALPLWKQTAHDLRAWLAVRGTPAIPELFVSNRGGPITRHGFDYILRQTVNTAAEVQPSLTTKRVTPHSLRHSCALMVLQATGDLRKVSLWLGHASLQTTEIYLRADPTEKLDAINAMLPPALRRGQFQAPDKLLASLRTGQ